MTRLALGLALFCAGCADTDIVYLRKQRKGPVPEVGITDPGGGHIRYPLKGPEKLKRKRHKRAYKRMAKICRGETLFRVMRVYTSEDADTPFSATNLVPEKLLGKHYTIEKYRHIHFECVSK